MIRNRKGNNNRPLILDRHKRGSKASDSTLLNVAICIVGSVVLCCTLVWFYQLISILNVPKDDGVAITRSNKDRSTVTLRQKALSQLMHVPGPHLQPRLPTLPVFAPVPNAEQLMTDTLSGSPTIAGVAAILQKYLSSLHDLQLRLSKQRADISEIIYAYTRLTSEQLSPFDEAYRGRSIFDIREDDSIFISIAAFREHLLDQTLRYAFDNAENPDKIFVGAVVQNCFGLKGGNLPCKTGAQVTGKNKKGMDMTKVSDAPPDVNGIETFCAEPLYKKYCDAGQVRVIYMDENEALGPAFSRYFASKLWGGETFFIQVDAHLEFARHWDTGYIEEVKAARNYPKAVLSSYPPGFDGGGGGKLGTSPGAKLCHCEFSSSDVEDNIIRINVGGIYKGNDERPKQIPFIAAGFFFARSEFLVDVPFDPFLPWCFMGEEIALSIRAWTSGWDIYAPRLNLIAHQYRPGRMGLPKFWGSVGRTWQKPGPGFNTKLGAKTIHRIKNLVGYSESSKETVEKDGMGMVLQDLEYYGAGTIRSKQEYMDLARIDIAKSQCHQLRWCQEGEFD